MTRVRRPASLFVFLRDSSVPDVRKLLQGKLEVALVPRFAAVSLASGRERLLRKDELAVLQSVPVESWTEVSDLCRLCSVSPERVAEMAGEGLLISEQGSTTSGPGVEERFQALHWFPFAALYHRMSRWSSAGGGPRRLDLEGWGGELESALQEHLAREGPAPAHFHSVPSDCVTALPSVEWQHGLYQVLRSRKTDRMLEAGASISREQLAGILQYVYGCQGISRFSEGLSVIQRTSPSGGSLHPIEVYPLILAVDGVPTGLYHYSLERHALEEMRRLSSGEAREMALTFTAGQPFTATAAALFLMTARFRRTFWKYANHAKAYRVVLLDAGHLSQTFYLVCTELGLGGFFTSAICETDIERTLGIDPLEEGPIGICGCGVIDRHPPREPFRHDRYEPPRG